MCLPAVLSLRTVALLLGFQSSLHAGRVFYTDQPTGLAGSVRVINVDGSNPGVVVTYPGTPNLRGIGWHAGTGRIFVLDNAAKVIRSMLPGGTGEQAVADVDADRLGSDLEVDEANNRIYWAETSTDAATSGRIRTCALDGSDVTTAVTTASGTAESPYFIHLDRTAGFIHWGVLQNASNQNGPTTFRRASFAGVIDPSFGITTTTRSRDIAIDPADGMAYFADRQTGTLFRRPVLGGLIETVISGLNAPHGIALDVIARKIYWADTGQRGTPSQSSARRVSRCNFDGSEYQNLSENTGGNEPWDLTLDLSSPTYTQWVQRFFPPTAGQRGALDDPDGDGTQNMVEYAFNGHPRNVEGPGSTAKISAQANGTGIRYPRRRTSPLTYQLQVSTDLQIWHFNGDGSGQTWMIETSVNRVDAEMDEVTIAPAATLATEPKLFYRLRILSTEP